MAVLYSSTSKSILIWKVFLVNNIIVSDITVAKYGCRHTATVVASYLSMVESNSESENDDGLTVDNEAGS